MGCNSDYQKGGGGEGCNSIKEYRLVSRKIDSIKHNPNRNDKKKSEKLCLIDII